MEELKKINVKPEEVTIDKAGKVIISNPTLALAIENLKAKKALNDLYLDNNYCPQNQECE